MKKTVVVFLHLGYWLMYLLLLAVVFAAVTVQVKKTQNIYAFFPIVVLYLAPNLLSFYASYFLLFPKFLPSKRFVPLAAAGLAVSVLAALSGSLISTLFYGFEQPVLQDSREFLWFTVSLALIAAVHAAIALIIKGFIVWYDELKLKEELVRKNFEMESALIKSQLNPHFLFNTLNNIDVLINKDPEKASRYLNRLSDILRYLVYETKTERIALGTELDYLEKYLELQKIRTVNPDYVNFTVTGAPGNLTIAPMLLFPFIENAFKHTENRKNSASIRIKILIEEKTIVFECENSNRKSAPEKQDFGGAGNALVEKRLNLLYPGAHRLEISETGDVYRVKLTLYED